MDIRVAISGAHEVGLRFEEFPDALYEDLRAEIDALSKELYALIEAATPNATGKLRGEERVRLFTDPNQITGYIDIAGSPQDFGKAAALEYGAHGQAKVSAHQMRLDHAWGQMFAEPELVMVSAYTRDVDIQEVAFERGPLAAMAPEIIARLNAVVEKNVAEANA